MSRRARRFHSGLVWHLTQRCHQRHFLLRFARDRRLWGRWLVQARKRYGLCVLNHIATSNHVHLLVLDRGRDEISRGMQLAAGRTAQAYNRRKNRIGAFWQGRYATTAVEADDHLRRCITYIDLNMVRAGAVEHPLEWADSGYTELIQPKKRYLVADHQALAALLGFDSLETLVQARTAWAAAALQGPQERQPLWTESLAVGSETFVRQAQSLVSAHGDSSIVMPTNDGSFMLVKTTSDRMSP